MCIRDRSQLLRELVGQLKPEFREALVLRDIQGYSYEEVAAITGQNLGTVKSRINPVSYTHLDVYKRQVLKTRFFK